MGVLKIIVTPEGKVARIKVERVIGFGLDQKAVNAVCQWKFTPALREGQPVAVQITVEVTFRLY
jgi:TonB family protein